MNLPPRAPCAQSTPLRSPIRRPTRSRDMRAIWLRWVLVRAIIAAVERRNTPACWMESWPAPGARQVSGAKEAPTNSPSVPIAARPTRRPGKTNKDKARVQNLWWLPRRSIPAWDCTTTAPYQMPLSGRELADRCLRLQRPKNAKVGRHSNP